MGNGFSIALMVVVVMVGVFEEIVVLVVMVVWHFNTKIPTHRNTLNFSTFADICTHKTTYRKIN